MPVFTYKAAGKDGRTRRGSIEADSSRHATKLLKGKGLFPIEVKATRAASTGKAKVSGESFSLGSFTESARRMFQSVNRAEVAATIRQLATLLGANMALDDALTTMVTSGGKSRMITVLTEIREKLREGGDLAGAFADHPHIFNSTFVTMIKAGETSGTLEIVMERMAEHMEQQLALKRKVQSALAYPMLMFVVGIGVSVFLLLFVIPKVTQIFIDMKRALPLPTQILIGVSNFFQAYWPTIVVAVFALGIAFNRYRKTAGGKARLDAIFIKAPLIGPVMRQLAVGNFSRTLGMLLNNGVTLVKGLDIVKSAAGNMIMEKTVLAIHKDVQEGRSLTLAMRESPIFDHTSTSMIAAGETSGELEKMLLTVASTCEKEVEARLQIMTSLMEPIMILVLGGMVGFVVMAIIMPIFEMRSMVG